MNISVLSQGLLSRIVVKATQNGEKLKQGCNVTGNRTRDLVHPRPRTTLSHPCSCLCYYSLQILQFLFFTYFVKLLLLILFLLLFVICKPRSVKYTFCYPCLHFRPSWRFFVKIQKKINKTRARTTRSSITTQQFNKYTTDQ